MDRRRREEGFIFSEVLVFFRMILFIMILNIFRSKVFVVTGFLLRERSGLELVIRVNLWVELELFFI